MRYPTTHRFLTWAGPALLASIVAIIAGFASLAAVYPGVKDQGAAIFDECWPVISAGWFLAVIAITTLLYVAAIIWTGQPSSKKLRNKRASVSSLNQLYVFKNPVFEDPAEKAYMVIWSPKAYFDGVFSDWESQARSIPPKPAKEKVLTFYLFNPGPDDVRHIKLTWSLGNQNITDEIKASGLYSGFIESISDNFIQIATNEPGRASSWPFATSLETEIPILKNGETISISPPKAVQKGFEMLALSLAKRVKDSPRLKTDGTIQSILKAMDHDMRRITPVTLHVSFVDGHGVNYDQDFAISGWLRGRVMTHTPKPNPETSRYEIEPGGITASIDHMEVHKL